MGMERRDPKGRERIEAILNILKKHAPLTLKQEKFCNDACVERFLQAKGGSVKKAAKQLRAALSWRESIGIDHLIADEFSAELAGGFAYVAGHDDEARPAIIFRIKQDYPKNHSQKLFVRLLVFTLEVAISSMSRFVDQFVILFDASFFRSAPVFLNFLIGTLKIISDYYPRRLHKAFVIDPPSLFSYLWKGVRPFVELTAVTAVVSSLDFEDSLEDAAFVAYPTKAASLRFDPAITAKITGGGSTSSRFSFTVSHLHSLKPWYLSTTTTTERAAAAPTASPSLVGASPINARSYSFASPAARSTPRSALATRSIPSTPCSFPPLKQQSQPLPLPLPPQHPRTPRPSFLPSPAALFSFRREAPPVTSSRADRERESFLPYLKFHRRPYDEMVYRAKMRPPLGGLISIIGPHLKQQQHQQQLRRNTVNIHHQRSQTLNY